MDERTTCVKIVITASRDFLLADWINFNMEVMLASAVAVEMNKWINDDSYLEHIKLINLFSLLLQLAANEVMMSKVSLIFAMFSVFLYNIFTVQ